eukprot:gnl/MRDRNA2_/MRDRNA2_224473_c0_seq1.p1 gnl/MRDRNA2_/MRDRNA2_224473_c0~~gnl/MRDRNA2_/MRDRNA2_224473_c0_seq1.p1  ORF type:complete len:189 (-),score=24.15 gnl/MRDRNA2_/MRDRNA2_224473_c0_seq1:459-953(-)
MDPVEVAVCTSLICLAPLTIWSAVTEGLAPCKEILTLSKFLAVSYTCIGAVILNIAALFVLQELGPVTQQVVGQLKCILAILGAVATFCEVITMQQIIGYTLLVIGLTWYSRTELNNRTCTLAGEEGPVQEEAFSAPKADGSVASWGNSSQGGDCTTVHKHLAV